jgi:hypothetical protein
LIVLLLTVQPLSAQDEMPWLSLDRLTVSSSATYHYRPWNFYNNSLSLVEQAVRYDPTYSKPSGSFEKIVGDVGGELCASYRILSGFSLEILGSYAGTDAALELVNEYSSPPVRDMTTQEIFFSVYEVGFGARYSLEFIENLRFAAVVRLSKAFGTMEYEYLFIPSWNWKYTLQTKLQDRTIVPRVAFEASYPLWHNLKFTGSVEYRWMSFDRLEGSGKITRSHGSGPDYEDTFRARLAQIKGYFFGVEPIDGTYIINEHLTRTLWSRTELWSQQWFAKGPARLDLSSFGFKLGLSYEF